MAGPGPAGPADRARGQPAARAGRLAGRDRERADIQLRRSGQRTRAHAEAARITGYRFTGTGIPRPTTAVVLDTPQPAVYCMPGRPATIVLTTGALGVLEPAQLRAVLAHERAHLTGRHHVLVRLSRGLAASIRGVPLFRTGAAEIAGLAELRADDVAARHSGRPVPSPRVCSGSSNHPGGPAARATA